MRIVITHPFCWPYVRRGAERNIAELACYLTRRGHDVVTVSSKPDGEPVEELGDGGRRLIRPAARFPLMSRLRLKTEHTFYLTCGRVLKELDADVVHSLFYTDALAASRFKNSHNYRTVYQVHGVAIPGVSCYRWFPPEGWMMKEAAQRADRVYAVSEYVREQARKFYRRDVEMLWSPVDLTEFTIGRGPQDGRPTILAVANFDLRYKGVRALVKSFQLVKDRLPSALLRLSGHISAEVEKEVLSSVPESTRRAIEVLGVGHMGDVPKLYREASVTVLPSLGEPSGRVLIESWASGTPVVATNHGGLPEFVNPKVGVLFEPKADLYETMNVDGLAEAILEALALSEKKGIRETCRTHALQFSYEALGPKYEELYARSS
jgi:glycosyltransferase involved in cell wall biosynthesis